MVWYGMVYHTVADLGWYLVVGLVWFKSILVCIPSCSWFVMVYHPVVDMVWYTIMSLVCYGIPSCRWFGMVYHPVVDMVWYTIMSLVWYGLISWFGMVYHSVVGLVWYGTPSCYGVMVYWMPQLIPSQLPLFYWFILHLTHLFSIKIKN